MRFLFLMYISIFPGHAKAAGPIELAYVHYQDKSSEHHFWFEETANGKMNLKFKDGEGQVKSKLIPEGRATLLTQKITKAYWDSQFKKNLKPSECSVYARVRIPGERIAPICSEQGKVSGWLYGTLVEMNSYFR